MNKDSFRQSAGTLMAEIENGTNGKIKVPVERKEFSTGSVGWYSSNKGTIIVNGEEVRCNINVTITVVGSKEWK